MRKSAKLASILNPTSAAELKTFQKTYISTTFPILDYGLIKRGGIPCGHVTEIYGKPGSGKSLLAYQIIAEAQKKFPNKIVGIVDSEFTLDPDWLEQQGIDLTRLQFIQTNILEDAFDQVLLWAKDDSYSLIVLDSIGNLQTKVVADREARFREKNGNAIVDQPGAPEKSITAGIKAVVPFIYQNDIALVIVNQIRASFGYGSTVETPGGNNLKHNLTLRLELTRVGDLLESGDIVGMISKAVLRRSKLGVGGSTNESNHLKFIFYGGSETREVYNIWDTAVLLNLITQSGPFFTFNKGGGDSEFRWKGKTNAINDLVENTEKFKIVKNIVDEVSKSNPNMGIGSSDEPTNEEVSEE